MSKIHFKIEKTGHKDEAQCPKIIIWPQKSAQITWCLSGTLVQCCQTPSYIWVSNMQRIIILAWLCFKGMEHNTQSIHHFFEIQIWLGVLYFHLLIMVRVHLGLSRPIGLLYPVHQSLKWLSCLMIKMGQRWHSSCSPSLGFILSFISTQREFYKTECQLINIIPEKWQCLSPSNYH
jgi:hypothetical protein